ncbi:MAG: dienelactone hydrolase family protein [Alphaproteobacteria bacterium]|nr:dienelactone hydrolase family protein [Alphaproteobacteria bacterium]
MKATEILVQIPVGKLKLEGGLTIPQDAYGLVLFAHGSGSSRKSPRNRYVAQVLNEAGIATLLFDLLTAEEEVIDERTRELRFNIELLSERLEKATDWVIKNSTTKNLNLGYFGASTGAAAALIAETRTPHLIRAIVSRGGRPDLAHSHLPKVKAPTLLLVGGLDEIVIELNERALSHLTCPKKLVIIKDATHLFEESGTLEEVAETARDWFLKYFSKSRFL